MQRMTPEDARRYGIDDYLLVFKNKEDEEEEEESELSIKERSEISKAIWLARLGITL